MGSCGQPHPRRPKPLDKAIRTAIQGLGLHRVGLGRAPPVSIPCAGPRWLRSRKGTGTPHAAQLLLGRTKMDSMVRCLAIDIVDDLTLSKGIDL